MPNVTADISVIPIGTGSIGISDYIAASQSALQRYPNLVVQLNPMSTTLQGELDEILRALHELHEAPFYRGALRVSTSIRIDDRRDGKQQSLTERVEAVERRM